MSANQMKPLLIDIPEMLETDRLRLKVPRTGDGNMIHATVMASLDELRPWLKWAAQPPSLHDSEEFARHEFALFCARVKLPYLLIEKRNEQHVGSISLNHIDWSIPCGEFAYFVCTPFAGNGYMAEAVDALTIYVMRELAFKRIEIRMDTRNLHSQKLAERCGFAWEGTLRKNIWT